MKRTETTQLQRDTPDAPGPDTTELALAADGPYRSVADEIAALPVPPRGLIVRRDADELVIETLRSRRPLVASLACVCAGVSIALVLPYTKGSLVLAVALLGAINAFRELMTGTQTLHIAGDRVTFRKRRSVLFHVRLAAFRTDGVGTGPDIHDSNEQVSYLKAIVDGQEQRLFTDMPDDRLAWIDQEIRRVLAARAARAGDRDPQGDHGPLDGAGDRALQSSQP
jgi:hypothetical protein